MDSKLIKSIWFAKPQSIQQKDMLEYLNGLSPSERTELLGEMYSQYEMWQNEWEWKEKGFPTHYATILTFVASGLSNKKIAEKLNLSERTIKNYLSITYRILGVNNRTQAVVVAIQRGIILGGK